MYGPGTDSGTFDYFTKAIVGEEKANATRPVAGRPIRAHPPSPRNRRRAGQELAGGGETRRGRKEEGEGRIGE